MSLTILDLAIVGLYAAALFIVAIWVSREPAGHAKSTEDYFLAGRALPWWAIGASLIASNISAEQIIGQSGQGFAVGIAIAAYEWQAAIVLLVVAKWFLPIFLKRGVYTMPQYLDQRYGHGVKTLMSFYWILLYTAVNLTTVLWLGGLAVTTLTGWPVFYAMLALAVFSAVYSLYGGLKAVALTDIIQVVVLVFGGIAITWFALNAVSGGNGAISGLGRLMTEVPDHFRMILPKSDPAYSDLPGIWTLLGGLWVLHFSYWGFNQYIIQRALGAENLAEAQTGLAFAAFLKLLIPLIVVIPGIAAVILAEQGTMNAAVLSERSDQTYGELMRFAPSGLRGLVFAALIAAIVSSLASMMNSISTIFTMDVYKTRIPNRSEQHYVLVGRITAMTAIVCGVILAQPFIGGFESGFQTVQEYSGFIAPGVVVIFLFGFFWKRMNTHGAFAALLGSVAFNVAMKFLAPEVPFILRIWLVTLACVGVSVLASLLTRPHAAEPIPASERVSSFKTTTYFNLMSVLVVTLLVAAYAILW